MPTNDKYGRVRALHEAIERRDPVFAGPWDEIPENELDLLAAAIEEVFPLSAVAAPFEHCVKCFTLEDCRERGACLTGGKSSVAPSIDAEAVSWALGKLEAFGLQTKTANALMMDRLKLMLLNAPASSVAAQEPQGHDWQPDGGVLRFESHPHGEAPHVHTTCAKCGARAWFLEFQWELLAKGCATASPRIEPKHVCGLQGFNPMIDGPCLACVSKAIAPASATETSENDLRIAFEKWCALNNLVWARAGDDYRSPYAQWCWRAFYAATRLAESRTRGETEGAAK